MPIISPDPTYTEFDAGMLNNVGSNIKVRNLSIYLDQNRIIDDEYIKERIASELGYEGIGTYQVYAHDPDLKIGDQIPTEVIPTYMVSIAVSANSAVMTSSIGKSDWIPVAAIDQKTRLSLKSGDVTLTISEDALSNHLDSWTGGYINVNHENNGKIDTFEIEGAKFEDGMLYHKVGQDVAEFIRNSASSGRSIEIQPLKIIDNKVVEYNGLGLSVLYPPFKPACGPDMGCSSTGTSLDKDKLWQEAETDTQDGIKEIFTKLAHKLKLQSSMNHMNVESWTGPYKEKTMNEDIEKLTSARIGAEHGRDEAIKEVETLKSSLVDKEKSIEEKDKLISEKSDLVTDQEKTISEQTDKLKSYADAEVAAADKLMDERWETAKSSIPPGKIHKQEDHDALKKIFVEDPHEYIATSSTWKRENPTGESGADHTPESNDDDLALIDELNLKAGRIST